MSLRLKSNVFLLCAILFAHMS